MSQLKQACVDRGWLDRWLDDPATPVPMPMTPAGGIPVNGRLFHQLVAGLVQKLCVPDASAPLLALRSREQIWALLWDELAAAKVQALVRSQSAEAALHLAEALKAWCQRLAELRANCPNFKSWRSALLTHEFDLKRVAIQVSDGGVVEVSGRPDSVQVDPVHGIVVVDYKLSRGSNGTLDLLQLAIYARMLRLAKPGLNFAGLLEYYEPGLHLVPKTEAQLNAIFEHEVQPVLDRIAGHEKLMSKLKSVQVGHEAVRLSWQPKAEPDLGRDIEKAYNSFKVPVQVMGRVEAPQLVRYLIRPGLGISFAKLRSNAVNLKIQLGLHAEPLVMPGSGHVIFDVVKEKPDTVWWQDEVQRAELTAHASPLALALGVDINNRLILADLCDSNTAHALIGGSSGSGKSELLKSLVATLVKRNRPETLQLTLIDPKLLTFGGIVENAYLTGPILRDIEESLACLHLAVEDMERRYEILLAENHTRLGDRIAQGKTDLPFRVIIFDEFADLINSGREEKKEFERLTKRLSAKGRAAGVHLIIATQRPDKDVVTGQLKANLPMKICLRVTNAVNSQILLDEPGAEHLLGRGDFLSQTGSTPVRGQSLFIPQKEFLELFADKI